MRSTAGNIILLVLSAVILILFGAVAGNLYRQWQRPTVTEVIEDGSKDGKVPASKPVNKPSEAPTSMVNIKVKPEDAVLGNPEAKVTIIEFGDFQCPFCGRFFKESEPQLRLDYVQNGKARFVFKHLAFLGKESIDAANASLCAKEQGKFWEYHDKLYQNQMGENQGAFSIPALKRFASDLDLNTGQFANCLDSQKYSAQVQADTTEASSKGYNSTPTTFINGTVIVGAQPYATFKAVIDEKLASQP